MHPSRQYLLSVPAILAATLAVDGWIFKSCCIAKLCLPGPSAATSGRPVGQSAPHRLGTPHLQPGLPGSPATESASPPQQRSALPLLQTCLSPLAAHIKCYRSSNLILHVLVKRFARESRILLQGVVAFIAPYYLPLNRPPRMTPLAKICLSV